MCTVILAGVFSGTFVTEITGPEGLRWLDFYKTSSFYALLVLAIVIYFYEVALYRYEKDILRFADKEYCLAYMRSLCLPAAAERYRQMIRQGQVGELERAMEEVRRILK